MRQQTNAMINSNKHSLCSCSFRNNQKMSATMQFSNFCGKNTAQQLVDTWHFISSHHVTFILCTWRPEAWAQTSQPGYISMDFSLILTKINWKDPERNRNDLKGHCSVSMSSSCVAQCLLKHHKMRFSDLPRWRGCCRYRQTNLSQIDLCREYGKRMETYWDTLTKVLDSWKASERERERLQWVAFQYYL